MTILGVCGASGSVSAGQDAPPTFRAVSSRVSLNVVVKDHRGRVVRDLASTDFQVFDQGLAVPITDFRTGEEPISVAILVDTSGSMHIGARLAAARQAVDLLLTQFRPGDEAALFTFDKTLCELVPFSTDVASLRNGFARVDAFGSTALHDAVAAAAQQLSARPSSRRAVIAITDGLDNSSQLSAVAASGIARSTDVPVYVLAVANATLPVAAKQIVMKPAASGGVARLDALTASTGGASFAAETTVEAGQSVQQILTDLRTGYVLAFTPNETLGWHQLTVRVAHKTAQVRTRAGFWMGQPEASNR